MMLMATMGRGSRKTKEDHWGVTAFLTWSMSCSQGILYFVDFVY
jgi:hypothetical protein